MQLAPRPDAEGEGEQAEQGAQRRHQNRAEPHARGFPDGDLERYVLGLHPQPREIEQNDPVLHDEADQQDQAHERGDVQSRAGHEQEPQRADERDGRHEQDDQRLDKRLELHHHHRAHTGDGKAEHEQQGAEGFLLARVLTSEDEPHARGHGVDAEHPLDVSHDAAQRAAADPRRHGDHLLLVLAIEAHPGLGRSERRETAERRDAARHGALDGQRAQPERVEPHRIGRPHAHGHRPVFGPNLPGGDAQ